METTRKTTNENPRPSKLGRGISIVFEALGWATRR